MKQFPVKQQNFLPAGRRVEENWKLVRARGMRKEQGNEAEGRTGLEP